jgi:MinD superfamily P-loop ATPase
MLRQIATVEASMCTLCGSCLTVCPNDAIEVRMDAARVLDPALCQGDGLCVAVCSGPLALEWRDVAPYDPAAVERRKQKLERLRALGAEV